MTLIEAAKQALGALEVAGYGDSYAAIDLREALAQPQDDCDGCGEVCRRSQLCYGCDRELEEANARLGQPQDKGENNDVSAMAGVEQNRLGSGAKDGEVAQPLYTTPPVVPQGEPVYYQWRRKHQPWSIRHVYHNKVEATTDDSEVRELYTTPPSVEAAIERERLMGYATAQMAVEAMRIETLEKAAKVCDDIGEQITRGKYCAAAIRSMK